MGCPSGVRSSKLISLWIRRSKCIAIVLSLIGLTPAWAGTTNYYYDAAGRLVAAYRTAGNSKIYSVDSSDNRTSIVNDNWSLPYQPSGIQAYTVIFQNQAIISADGRFELILQADGNLVLYEGSTYLWDTSTNGHQSAILVNWGNGNLALYDAQLNLLWQTNTAGYPNANLVLQNDGNLVMYYGSTAIWNSGTGGH